MDVKTASALVFRPLMRGLSTSRIAASICLLMLVVTLVVTGCAQQNQAPLCQPGSLLAACREHCQSDGDCLAPSRCDAATSTCRHPPIACDPLDSSQSPTNSDGGTGTNSICGTEQECDLVTSTCSPRAGAACKQEFDCRAGEVCSGSSCTPAGSSAACQRDGDCVAPNVCRLVLDASGSKLLSMCGSPVGPAEAGARCRDNGECQSGLCLRNGICYGGCQLGNEPSARSDCHAHDGVICGETSLVLRSGTDPAKNFSIVSCVLSPPVCQSDRDCDASGGSCQILVDPKKPTQLRTGCLPVRGLIRSGAACQRDTDCASGLCAAIGAARLCFAACRSVTDCRAMAMLVCKPAPYELDGVSGSVTSCVPGP